MRLINKTNNYTMYENDLENGDKFIIAISNTINSNIEINVKLNNNLAVIEPNKCYISITNIDTIDVEKIKSIIMKAWRNLQKQGYTNFSNNIKLSIDREEELELANKVATESGLRVIIDKSPKYHQLKEQAKLIDKKERIEKVIKANTITKIDNGIMKKYTERKADKYNTGYLLENISNEDILRKFREMLSDPNNQEIYDKMTEEQLANSVLDAIALEGNRKKYFLESYREQSNNNMKGTIASEVARQNEGTVNKETGIIINDPNKEDKINTIEEDKEQYNVVAPEINNVDVSSQGISNKNNMGSSFQNTSYSFNHTTTNDYYQQNDVTMNENSEESLSEEEQQKREVNKENVYVRKKVLSNTNKSTGIISLPIIIFLISGLLLITSAILFFISK